MIPFHGAQPARPEGHYESWFVRANHPNRPQAFWIRYTRFIPADARPALGELWAIWFDGDQNKVVAVKRELPLADCQFANDRMHATVGDSELYDHHLHGHAEHNGHRIGWSLNYQGEDHSLLLLPENLYDTKLPRAKSVVSRPQAQFSGELDIDGERIVLDQWPGSENHNWGSRHTDRYAWGQVAAFDNQPDAFLECITAQVKVGPLMSPRLTVAVVRVEGEDYLFNSLFTAFRARGRYTPFSWQFQSRQQGFELEVDIEGPASSFAALTYFNPPTGSKTCLNSKIARCSLQLRRPGKPALSLVSRHGAAFEILTDRKDHGRPLLT